MTNSPNPSTPVLHPFTRRSFLAATGASVAAFGIAAPELARGAEANSKINLGLIGCGGRGKWIADLFRKHGGYTLVAAADYFQDRLNEVGQQFGVPASNLYSGLKGHHRLLEQKGLDAVVIESPPYFHPEQAAAAVDAGKHVYLAKPIAVDVPGCLTVGECGKKATAKKLCFLADFQTRASALYREAAKAVHSGELGPIISVEASYVCGPTWGAMDTILRKDPKNPEVRLRAWGVDRTLSGDIITEQNIHALDVACWMLRADPIKAYGTGGRRRQFLGDCWDHFSVIYYFPNDIEVTFNSKQAGMGYDDILCRVYGMKGTVDTHYFGKVSITSEDTKKTRDVGNLYTDGAVNNIATFHQSITTGDYSNPTVAESVRSNLTTILGRTAAYQKREVTWAELMRTNERFVADLKGLKA